MINDKNVYKIIFEALIFGKLESLDDLKLKKDETNNFTLSKSKSNNFTLSKSNLFASNKYDFNLSSSKEQQYRKLVALIDAIIKIRKDNPNMGSEELLDLIQFLKLPSVNHIENKNPYPGLPNVPHPHPSSLFVVVDNNNKERLIKNSFIDTSLFENFLPEAFQEAFKLGLNDPLGVTVAVAYALGKYVKEAKQMRALVTELIRTGILPPQLVIPSGGHSVEISSLRYSDNYWVHFNYTITESKSSITASIDLKYSTDGKSKQSFESVPGASNLVLKGWEGKYYYVVPTNEVISINKVVKKGEWIHYGHYTERQINNQFINNLKGRYYVIERLDSNLFEGRMLDEKGKVREYFVATPDMGGKYTEIGAEIKTYAKGINPLSCKGLLSISVNDSQKKFDVVGRMSGITFVPTGMKIFEGNYSDLPEQWQEKRFPKSFNLPVPPADVLVTQGRGGVYLSSFEEGSLIFKGDVGLDNYGNLKHGDLGPVLSEYSILRIPQISTLPGDISTNTAKMLKAKNVLGENIIGQIDRTGKFNPLGGIDSDREAKLSFKGVKNVRLPIAIYEEKDEKLRNKGELIIKNLKNKTLDFSLVPNKTVEGETTWYLSNKDIRAEEIKLKLGKNTFYVAVDGDHLKVNGGITARVPSPFLSSDNSPYISSSQQISSPIPKGNSRLFILGSNLESNGYWLLITTDPSRLKGKKFDVNGSVKKPEDLGLKLQLFLDTTGEIHLLTGEGTRYWSEEGKSLQLGSREYLNLSGNIVKKDANGLLHIDLLDHEGFIKGRNGDLLSIGEVLRINNQVIDTTFLDLNRQGETPSRQGKTPSIINGVISYFLSPEKPHEIQIYAKNIDNSLSKPTEGSNIPETNLTAQFGENLKNNKEGPSFEKITATLNQTYLKEGRLFIGGAGIDGENRYITVRDWQALTSTGKEMPINPSSRWNTLSQNIKEGGIRFDLSLPTNLGEAFAEFEVELDERTGSLTLRSTWQDQGAHHWIPKDKQLTIGGFNWQPAEEIKYGLVYIGDRGVLGGGANEFATQIKLPKDWEVVYGVKKTLEKEDLDSILSSPLTEQIKKMMKESSFPIELKKLLESKCLPDNIEIEVKFEFSGKLKEEGFFTWKSSDEKSIYGDHIDIIPSKYLSEKENKIISSISFNDKKFEETVDKDNLEFREEKLFITRPLFAWFSIPLEIPGNENKNNNRERKREGKVYVMNSENNLFINRYTSLTGIPVELNLYHPFLGGSAYPDVFSFREYNFNNNAPFY
ncbi:MAG: hypothetical protein NC826_06480, partial [Candidatus Omnitrophica bacterium]|nr:hypothetical protein [Candidatus Omnitrophota bacterium]